MAKIFFENGIKSCSKCKQKLPIENFRKNTINRCGLHSQCRTCEQEGRRKHRKSLLPEGISVQKKENLRQSFNISPEEYIRLVEKHNNKCAICNNEETAKSNYGNNKPLAVDHCHETGKVRGLLCAKCNQGLGMFRDNIKILNEAINYLKEYKEE